MIHRYMSWYMMLTLTCYTWHLITDTWYLTPVLDMLYLTPDLWHLIYDTGTWHVILDTWYLTPVLDTWHLIYDTWRLTCYHSLDMLSHGTSTLDLILWHLTGYYYTWHLYYMAYSWLSLLRWLGMIIILLPDLWYSWTPVPLNSWTPVLLNSWTPVPLNSCIPCTHVPCTVTLVNSTVIPASGRACLVSGWRGYIPRSC